MAKQEVKVAFNVKDYLILNIFILGNIFYSILKRSLPTSIPILQTTLLITKIDIGNIYSQFSLSYGISKLFGGILCDIFPAYIIFIIGLVLGTIVNLSIIPLTNIQMIGYLWMLNGMAQGY